MSEFCGDGEMTTPYDQMRLTQRYSASEAVGDSPSDVRYFESGAYRDVDESKLDYEGFFTPDVLTRYAEYMHKNRRQSDGKMRDSDNWQRGIPRATYMKSMWRHFMDVFRWHRKGDNMDKDAMQDALCATIFNAMGYLHEMQNGR